MGIGTPKTLSIYSYNGLFFSNFIFIQVQFAYKWKKIKLSAEEQTLQTLLQEQSDLGLHCLLKDVYVPILHTWSFYASIYSTSFQLDYGHCHFKSPAHIGTSKWNSL